MSSSELSAPTRHHIRPEMVSSAVSFLRDVKVQQSTVSQRISFLESKGLNQDEIDEALRQTGQITAPQPGPSQAIYQQPQQYSGGPMYYNPAMMQQQQMHPQPRDRDWRDWFIMAVVSGAVGYGVIGFARKYLFPHLQPPNQTILEEDRDALTAKYDEVANQLAILDEETKAVKLGIEQQRESIQKSIDEVEKTIKGLRESDKQRMEEMNLIKSEVDQMKESIPRMFEKTKEAQTASLSELQNELKSLKSLLVSTRNSAVTSSIPSSTSANANFASRSYSPFAAPISATNSNSGDASPSFANTSSPRPSIPAWQLADSSSGSTAAKDAASTVDEPVGSSAEQAGKEHSKASATTTN